MDLMKEDLIFVIAFGFYMKKRQREKRISALQKLRTGLWYVERSLVGVAAHKSKKLTD
jgi:hypothetical protein